MGPAFKSAYQLLRKDYMKDRPTNILLLTDGKPRDSIKNIKSEVDKLKSSFKGIKIFTFGVGEGIDAEGAKFMKEVGAVAGAW